MLKTRKTKMEKGITLIALIITIVVLLILAAVAIASITNDGVLSYAENATTQYNQAVKNEQDTLQGYVDYLNKHNGGAGLGEGSGSENESGSEDGSGEETRNWTQTGTTVTDGTTILAVGDSVKVQVGNGSAEAYSANGYSKWKVLGAENGKLLLLTVANVGEELLLGGKEGYNTVIAQLNDICDDYLNTTYADEARNIKVEDINRVTGFNPDSYEGYGEQYTYTSSNFEHPTKGTASETNPITETSTYYYYEPSSSAIGEAAYNLLFNYHYSLASSYVSAGPYGASFGLYNVYNGKVESGILWDAGIREYYQNMHFARAVVSLKSDVKVIKV